MRIPLLTAITVMAMGCSAASECGPAGPGHCETIRAAASALAGGWTQLHPANGVSVFMVLSTRDTLLSGFGTFSGGQVGARCLRIAHVGRSTVA